MKDLKALEKYRDSDMYFDSTSGKFLIPARGVVYQVIASSGLGFDHVSISVLYGKRYNQMRIANYEELEFIRNMFFEEDEVVVEYHPKKSDYVNQNEYVLHLWKPLERKLPLPPEVTSFKDYYAFSTKKYEVSLKVTGVNVEGWQCYEVSVVRDGKPMKRFPSWEEMCMVKKQFCSEDSIALEYHTSKDSKDYSIDLWIPPKELEIPLPDPIMVGIRNGEDAKRLLKILFDNSF